jgi:gliding motility-associated-like protein
LVPVTVNAVNESVGISSPVVMINDTMLIKSTRCNSGNDCWSLRLIGRDTICSLPDTVVYRVVRNPGCTMPVQWRFFPETNNNYVYRQTDSTIAVFYGEPGNHQLKVLLTTPCRSFIDSVSIIARNGEPPVNLGPDIELCANSIVTLRAGPRYKTYRWQDGSIDSVYTAFVPGQYYVTVTDSCGGRYSDTINITPAPPVPFDLGADRLRCNNDTVRITAPAGFTQYTWGPNYNISSTSGQTVVVTPAADTTYTVTAVLRPGCIVTDSVRVRLRSAPRINLGNDTAFCRGNSITLDAGPGFSSYTWQDGTNGQQYTAQNAGAYSVAAAHASGCIVRDTLRILNLYNLPALNLGADTVLCQGNSITFDAGAGFLNYLWQDGSGNSSFTTAQTGSYWVQVTDANNCRNRDTVAILRIASLPAGFVPKDTAICQAQPIILRVSGNYRRYLWSTGQVSPAISISAPGAYWVEVTDANGCTARENMRVAPKECLRAIYFPSAFTPGVDGKNDLFRAIVYGVPQSFYLAVYNRWGQKVFETRDYTKGWNGSIGGVPQDSGGFIWYASWRFDGQETVSQKGTLLLIR